MCLFLGLSRIYLVVLLTSLFLISRFADIIVAGCCERLGLHFGMRDLLHLCGLCCAFSWACHGSNIFSPRAPFFVSSHVSLISIVAGCCKRFGLYLGMRDVLHLWGLWCPCQLTCRGSTFFSPRAFFGISCLADINLLKVVVN